MTDHYTEAERLLEEAYKALENGQRAVDFAFMAEAQVQALLAIADALTATPNPTQEEPRP